MVGSPHLSCQRWLANESGGLRREKPQRLSARDGPSRRADNALLRGSSVLSTGKFLLEFWERAAQLHKNACSVAGSTLAPSNSRSISDLPAEGDEDEVLWGIGQRRGGRSRWIERGRSADRASRRWAFGVQTGKG